MRYPIAVGLGILGLCSGTAHALEGWDYMGTASVLRWKTDNLEWNDSAVYGTQYPGSVSPGGMARYNALSCRGWARDIAQEHYKVSKKAVGGGELDWPSTDEFNQAYSETAQRVVRFRYKRWTTTEWTNTWIPLPYPANHCRVYAEHYAENLALDSGEDFAQGDVMYWMNTDASNNPDATGAAIQASATGPLAGKAAHVGMCSQVNVTGECYAAFHAHDYGRLEGIIGHRGSWTIHVAKYLYEELQAGLDGWGVRGTHTAIPENVSRQIYVYRSCDQERIDLALWRFWWQFEPNAGGTRPADERLYRVAAFTQDGTAELEYGQCAATSEALWDLSTTEGGNALYVNGADYESMVGGAWDNTNDYLHEQTNFWEGLFGNERRTTSVILHAFTSTGKSWDQVKDPDSDSAARDYTMESAAEKNPNGLSGINSPVVQYLQMDQLAATKGCYTGPTVWDGDTELDWIRDDLHDVEPVVFDPRLTKDSVDEKTVVEPDTSDLAWGGDGPQEASPGVSSSPCQPGTAGLLVSGAPNGCFGAFIGSGAVATTASCVEGLPAESLEVTTCDQVVRVSSVSLHASAELAVIHLATNLRGKALPISRYASEPGAWVDQHNYHAQPLSILSNEDAIGVYGKVPYDWGSALVETETYPYADAEGSPIIDGYGQLIGLSRNVPGADDEVRAYVSAAAHYNWLVGEATGTWVK